MTSEPSLHFSIMRCVFSGLRMKYLAICGFISSLTLKDSALLNHIELALLNTLLTSMQSLNVCLIARYFLTLLNKMSLKYYLLGTLDTKIHQKVRFLMDL